MNSTSIKQELCATHCVKPCDIKLNSTDPVSLHPYRCYCILVKLLRTLLLLSALLSFLLDPGKNFPGAFYMF